MSKSRIMKLHNRQCFTHTHTHTHCQTVPLKCIVTRYNNRFQMETGITGNSAELTQVVVFIGAALTSASSGGVVHIIRIRRTNSAYLSSHRTIPYLPGESDRSTVGNICKNRHTSRRHSPIHSIHR